MDQNAENTRVVEDIIRRSPNATATEVQQRAKDAFGMDVSRSIIRRIQSTGAPAVSELADRIRADCTDEETKLAIAMRERAAYLDERNQTRKALADLREKFNKLAVENAKLSDNGRQQSYLDDLAALTKFCEEVGIEHAQSTGHSTLLVMLREKWAELRNDREELEEKINRLRRDVEFYKGMEACADELFKRANDQLADLRKCRQAWDAVRKRKLLLESCGDRWRVHCFDQLCVDEWHADPREAVLALKGQLEGGK